MASLDERLAEIFRGLGAADQASLLAFAEFLASRAGAPRAAVPAAAPKPEIPAPEDIPRPDEERVVAAVKRLSRTYHMLDKNKMLNETSTLMTQHVMQGRDAVEVIDELEILFRRHYEALKAKD